MRHKLTCITLSIISLLTSTALSAANFAPHSLGGRVARWCRALALFCLRCLHSNIN